MVINFCNTNVTVNTGAESMLFCWMVVHNDCQEFSIDKKRFKLLENNGEMALIQVTDESSEFTYELKDPYKWKFPHGLLDYNHAGDFTWIDRKGCIHIGTDLEGDISLTFKVENDWSISECSLGNRIYPEIKRLGFDEDSHLQYILDFKNYCKCRLFYNYADPLDSYMIIE